MFGDFEVLPPASSGPRDCVLAEMEHLAGHEAELDGLRRAVIRKTGGETLDQADAPIGRPKQQHPGIRGDLTAIKGGDGAGAPPRYSISFQQVDR
jgi:hypothetical protein